MQTVGYMSMLNCLKKWHGLMSVGKRGLCSASPATSAFKVCVVGSGPAGLYATDRVTCDTQTSRGVLPPP